MKGVIKIIKWQEEWKNNYKKLDQIKEMINVKDIKNIKTVTERYPMSIPRYYFNLINQNDPIMKLSVPRILETDKTGELDTSGERQNTKFKGVQHKYATTMLVLIIYK